MASLCLTNSELHVGVDWSRSTELARALSDPHRPPVLLYPGEGAIDIVRAPPPGPVTLVVVDGTWSQTKKVVRTNPVLSALPRYAFVPPNPSEYRIRKEPDDRSVATIEALVFALTALEGQPELFASLLAPFRAMIDFQIACEEQYRGARVRHARRRSRVRRMRVPRVLTDRLHDVVCVVGEANAWPYATKVAAPLDYADELVHWAAHRPSSGETLSFIVAPKRPLADGTPGHTGIDEATLRCGGSFAELEAKWRAFVRDSDVICSWGRYETSLFTDAGGYLPTARLDLRQIVRDITRGNVRSLCEFPTPSGDDLDVIYGSTLVPGRAGRKLRSITDVVKTLVGRAATDPRFLASP